MKRTSLGHIGSTVVLLLCLNLDCLAQVLGYAAGMPVYNVGYPLQSGFYQTADFPLGTVPDRSHVWMHLITVRHGNTDNNHQLQIGASYAMNDRLFFRKIAGGNETVNPDWVELATRGGNTFTGTQVFNADNPGNVLIGKLTQANSVYRLDVAGKARADEVVVNTTGADYVFKRSYRLPSLAEVERHIQERGRLPDIPSAAQMQSEGMGVGEMQTLLLQKVEELTLYLIEQQKQIQALEEENATIRREVSQQKNKD